MSSLRLPLAAVLFLFLSLSACQSYVNIPAEQGDIAKHDPNRGNVRDVCCLAITEVFKDRPGNQPLAIVLPDGSDESTYDYVVNYVQAQRNRAGKELAGNVFALFPSSDAAPAKTPAPITPQPVTLDARQVRIRGYFAQVDVIRPLDDHNPDADRQLVTVYIKYDVISGWKVTDIRPWRINVDQALHQSVIKSRDDFQGKD